MTLSRLLTMWIVFVAECGKYMPADEAVNAYYMSKEYLIQEGSNWNADSSMIVYCYEYIELQQRIMNYLVTPGQGDTIIPSNII